jgi:hypothetical protein
MRRVTAAVGRVHYGGNHDLPRVRLCEPRLYDQGTPDSSSLGKDEDAANLLDEHSARGGQNRPHIVCDRPVIELTRGVLPRH